MFGKDFYESIVLDIISTSALDLVKEACEQSKVTCQYAYTLHPEVHETDVGVLIVAVPVVVKTTSDDISVVTAHVKIDGKKIIADVITTPKKDSCEVIWVTGDWQIHPKRNNTEIFRRAILGSGNLEG